MKTKILASIALVGALALGACSSTPDDPADTQTAETSTSEQTTTQEETTPAEVGCELPPFAASMTAEIETIAAEALGVDDLEGETTEDETGGGVSFIGDEYAFGVMVVESSAQNYGSLETFEGFNAGVDQDYTEVEVSNWTWAGSAEGEQDGEPVTAYIYVEYQDNRALYVIIGKPGMSQEDTLAAADQVRQFLCQSA